MSTYFIVGIVSYLLGSIPFGYILVRLFRGQDIRQSGSGNIGATNVMRSGAKGLGALTLLLDALKGYVAVLFGFWMAYRGAPHWANAEPLEEIWRQGHPTAISFAYWIAALAALCAIVGHMFPIWLKFKGGKGVATGVGAFIALAPKAVLFVLLIFVAVVSISRYVSLGSIVATAVFPIFVWLLYRSSASPEFFAAMLAAAALIIARHHQNIRRLLAGTEHRLELKHR